jgi:DUF4097 and DUF4098 domain-containing protein YvlB
MKRIILLLALLPVMTYFTFAQRIVQKTLEVQGKKVVMKFDFADSIVVEAWDKNTLELQVSVNICNNGYNDDYKLNVNEFGNKLELIEKVDFKNVQSKSKDNDNLKSVINYTLKVPANLEFELKTISGNVELKGTLGKMTINSISGFIDYTIPKSHSAHIDLSTVTGNVYSDLKFEEKEQEKMSWVGTKRNLALNGGNVAVILKTVSGDIFIREGR